MHSEILENYRTSRNAWQAMPDIQPRQLPPARFAQQRQEPEGFVVQYFIVAPYKHKSPFFLTFKH
jgi:hypothetical protein